MAKINNNTYDMSAKIAQVANGQTGAVTQAVLRAGADVYVREWKNKIVQNHHVITRSMHDSVAVTDITIQLDGGKATVKPDMYDSRGVANALKANAINVLKAANPNGRGAKYRRKKGINGKNGDRFVAKAQQAARADAENAMQQALNEFITG